MTPHGTATLAPPGGRRSRSAASARAIRVCHLAKYYPPAAGGIETHVRTLAQAQARLGLEVEALCVNHRPGPTTRERDGAVAVTRFAPSLSVRKLELSRELVRALWAVEADILHLQVPNPTMILALLLARPEIPLVATYQSDVVRQRVLRTLFRPLERLAFRRVRLILPTSPTYAEGSEFLAAYRDRIEVLPMGLDLAPYVDPPAADRAKAEELRRSYPSPIWLSCGRLIYYKGLHNAIRALPAIPGTLLIVGEGPERPALEAEARRMQVAGRVVFVGELPNREIVPYYLAAAALLFPSNARSEAFGLVQVEAMAAGCPVVNTRIPASGVPWVSRHEESGLTVQIDDPEALAAAANRLLGEPGLRERLGEAARRRAAADFDWRVMAARSVEVYRRVLASEAAA